MKRIQKEKAKHRTGMIKNRTGSHSENQYRKRAEREIEVKQIMRNVERKMSLNLNQF